MILSKNSVKSCACILICTSVMFHTVQLMQLFTTVPSQSFTQYDNIKNHSLSSTHSYTSCLEETLLNLPIGQGPKHKRRNDGHPTVWAHHWDARNQQWNQDIRFKHMTQLTKQPCSVWEVGAHTNADDSKTLMETYQHCQYHAYEPIPQFFSSLQKNWDAVPNMHLHHYGLAQNSAQINVSPSILNGQSTFIGDSKPQNNGDITLSIKSFQYAVKDAGAKPTLLHMNCEGCEWDLLTQAIDDGFILDIPIIQIGFHNYGEVGLGNRVIQYCRIRQKLSQTHRLMDDAVPFAWERWVLK